MAGVSAHLAVYHFSLHLRRSDDAQKDLRFAVLAAFITLYDLLCAALYDCESIAAGREVQRFQFVALCGVAISLAYFLDSYSGVQIPRGVRRAVWAAPVLGVIALVERRGWLQTDTALINQFTLPWLGEVTYYEVAPGPLAYLIALFIPGAALYLGLSAWRMWNAGHDERRRAKAFLVAVGLFLLGALNDGAVALGYLHSVYLLEYAWTAVIVLVGHTLSSEVVDAALAREALAESRERLAHAERLESVGQLAGGVAHDLNNMLTPVLAYAQLAQRKMAKDAPEREYLDHVISAADRAAALTRQLLAFGRKQVLEVRPVDVRVALVELEPLLRRLLPESVELRLQFAETLPFIAADVGQLEQVSMNLVANARDAMPSGGVITIDVQAEHTREAGTRLVITVTDNGEGMDAATIDRIFEPFYTTKPRGKGTGLGLATVHGIVRQHGGRITATSEIGRGTIFRLVFPAIARVETIPPPPLEVAHKAPATGCVLVVDDEHAVQELVRDVLVAQGFDVTTVGSEVSLRHVLASRSRHFDLLITDVVLPDTDGTRISAIVAKHCPDAAVLYMSGHAEDVLASRGVKRDTVELLHKPFSADTLVARVRDVLGDAQARERKS